MFRIKSGTPYPLGASITPDGVNFSVHSKSCTVMELLVFDDVNDAMPARIRARDPKSVSANVHDFAASDQACLCS